jgi:GrpB-like predicted nucleotidyltransferase (UPF0157 family)
MPDLVIIVDYDPGWPVLYEKERKQILEIIGDRILGIEHIGSTAVPGLGAKPIIDIMAGVRDRVNADECLLPLRKIGYTDVTVEPENPEWFYCLGKAPHSTGYHLHLMKYQSDHWKRHLAFRDYLRSHPEVAKKYFRLKKRLSRKYGTDRVGYTNAKTAFIKNIELTAQQQTTSKKQ